jgi:hypothetical protein
VRVRVLDFGGNRIELSRKIGSSRFLYALIGPKSVEVCVVLEWL